MIVLDTRTQRWRSEVSPLRPSGLMDWESITDLQHQLKHEEAVIMISPSPVFGVKLIEVIQQIVTLMGKPLVVDAENWMVHPGAAYTLLNLFRHSQTPKNFSILSGDVHYSFVNEVHIRGKQDTSTIWQINSSGIKNEFPSRLIQTLDWLNRWLFSPSSPLNWFTKRRHMKITPYKPTHGKKGHRLYNGSGVGMVYFNDQGQPQEIFQLNARHELVEFIPQEEFTMED